ncbi:phage terminase large subunit family protein [Kiloniella sp.]|uniref:phage terminase large subunit family protein n=1 Tax=Kiloniella sp. TaxID=1938587 RepID=UPI003B01A058
MAALNTKGQIYAALASGLAPAPTLKPSNWASENIVLVDGPRAGQKWDPNYAPYLVEILDRMDPADPCTKVRVRKPGQVGFTQVATAWLGYIAAISPANTLVVMPTISAALDYNEEKLDPAIDASPLLNKKIKAIGNRSGKASTARRKKFAGGFITLTGANSSVDLRSKTIKYAFRDEIDDWPLDLNGQGDPMEMVDARQRSFYKTGDYKDLGGSTPTIKGASRSDEEFENGDQRYFKITCPGCGAKQRMVFEHLKFDKVWPYNAYYVCPNQGCIIEQADQEALVAAGSWAAEDPAPGKYPSYHIDILISPAVTWNQVAEKFLDSKDDPTKHKAFKNLWLGDSWEERGDAPEWTKLYNRRLTYPRATIPDGGLVITMACDVQAEGIYYEVMAWGRDEVNWSIDAGYLYGDTGSGENQVWKDLDRIYLREYPDAYGQLRPLDLCGIDSGFNTEAVYTWVKRHDRAIALKGADGWGRAAIGTATEQDVNTKGKKRKKGGLKVWLVGTWGLKSKFYSNLRKDGARDGAEIDPPGYCHFSEFHDEGYFKQITAEYLKEVEQKGRIVRVWHAGGKANHYHDCRIYNMALVAHPWINLPGLLPEQWAELERERCQAAPDIQTDMAGIWAGVSTDTAPPEKEEQQQPEKSAAPMGGVSHSGTVQTSGYLSGAGGSGWLKGR